jgi:hypothetical protein
MGFLTRLKPKEQPDDIVLGRILSENGRGKQLHLTARDQEHHATIWGRTGSGKSKLLQSLFLQHLNTGHGICMIEPHHDLSLETLSYLVKLGFFRDEKAFRRLVYLDWGNGAFVPFNVLALPKEPQTVAMNALEAMMRVWPELRRAPNFQTLFLSAMIVLIENNLPITFLYQLLTDADARQSALLRVHDPLILQSFGTYERSHASVKDSGSTLRRGFLLGFNEVARLTLGQVDCLLDVRQLMDEGRSLIVNLGNIQDSETRRLIGALLLVQIEQAALSRTDLSPSQRRSWTVLVDEWPSFTASDSTIGNVLAQTRKFGLRLYLAAQSTDQVAYDRLHGALENCGVNLAFGLGHDSAVDLSRQLMSLDPEATKYDQLTGRVRRISSSEQYEGLAQDIQNLPPREAYVKLHNTRAVKIQTLSVPGVSPPNTELSQVLKRYRNMYQRSKEQAEADVHRQLREPTPTPVPVKTTLNLFSERDPAGIRSGNPTPPDLMDWRSFDSSRQTNR